MNNSIYGTQEPKHKKKIINATLSKLYKKLVFRQLKKLKNNCIELNYNNKSYLFGDTCNKNRVLISIHDYKFFQLLVFKGHLGFAESYGKGYFSTPKLTDLLTLFAQNFAIVDKAEGGLSWFFNRLQYLYYKYYEKNSLHGSKENIHAHYDLGNDLFETFLDLNMQYSSALYTSDDFTLEEAQIAKLESICNRLKLTSNDHVLEIGSGWGGLAIFMAKNIGCKVTTITISEEQFKYANSRIAREKLGSLIDIKICDYREVKGKYDKIVSIEMIEAVGEQYYQTYFNKCAELLKPSGLFLMQAILIADHEYNKAKNSVDFIKSYIFPGSNIPSLNRLNTAANQAFMCLVSYLDMTNDYAKTLYDWQTRFKNQSEKLLKLGYDKYFQNIWNFYFSYCQAGFLVGHIRDAHLVYKKR
ncbi:cyclopropane-fatty-acyl-phospholipid synthase family protein [Gammaproteobacteria bacterium]|nr:cyclopropane-fatty-acyl-phospholipid synthase family protein [Gammaproteobacteria bacterium]